MTPLLHIKLLGTPELILDNTPLRTLRSQKGFALLAYLACNPGPQRREFLADLLWDATSTAQSLSNLRTALSRLRSHLSDYLLITPENLAIAPDAAVLLDVTALERQSETTAGRLSPETAPQLEDALTHYRGDFLSGFHIPGATAFAQWAVIERERLHFVALQGYRLLTDYYLQAGAYPAGIRAGRAWLRLDGLDEEAHGQVMRLLASNDQRSAALAHYENCRQLLRAELNVEPSAEIQALHRQISQLQVVEPVTAPAEDSAFTPVPHNLPQRLTSFVGRDGELATIRTLFVESKARLVTLVGEGGVGKSSLAVAAGRSLLDAWADGVCYASLVDIAAGPVATLPRRLATALAGALGLTFSTARGAGDPTVQLFSFLRDRSLLLILDNFEHLNAGAPFVADLLQNAPGSRMLITSRVPLSTQAESVVRLGGLPVPQPTAALPLPHEAYASVALFADRARQRVHTFTVTSDNRKTLGHLCQLVAGNALALELAAAWVEHFSLTEMVALLETDTLDFLRSPQPHLPERHRSMRRTMETSWQLLSSPVQRVLAQLSIFRSSFHREALLAVTDGSVDVLVELVNCSLLQQRGPGRYDLHEVVRQFAAERLRESGDAKRQVAQRHAGYYLALVGSVGRTPALIAQVTEEFVNVRQAWNWAVENRDVAGLAGASTGLWNFYLRKGLFQEAEDAFGRAIAAVLATPDGRVGRRRALASLQVAQAVFLNIRSHYDEAIAVAEEGVKYALQEEDERIIAQGYLQWGTAHYRQGRYADAVQQFQMALTAARDAGFEGDQADVLRQLGVTWLEQSDFAQAQACCEEALALYRRTGNRLGEGNTLTDLGWMYQRQQNFEEARAYLEAAERTHTAIDNPHGAAIARLNLGIVLQMTGDFSAALDTYQQLFRELGEQPDPYHHSLVNHSLGVIFSRMGNYPLARRHLMTAIEIDRSAGDRGGLAWSYNGMGMVHNHLGDPKTALAYHKQALEIGGEQGAATVEGIALLGVGQDMQALGQWEQARTAYERAIAVQAQLKQAVRVMESRSGLARALLALDEPAAALAQVEAIIAHLTTQPLQGAAQPALIYWNCYAVLRGLDDSRAPTLLAEVFALVQSQAARIQDEHLRHSYLHTVPPHPAILREVESLQLSPRFGAVGVGVSPSGRGNGQ